MPPPVPPEGSRDIASAHATGSRPECTASITPGTESRSIRRMIRFFCVPGNSLEISPASEFLDQLFSIAWHREATVRQAVKDV